MPLESRDFNFSFVSHQPAVSFLCLPRTSRLSPLGSHFQGDSAVRLIRTLPKQWHKSRPGEDTGGRKSHDLRAGHFGACDFWRQGPVGRLDICVSKTLHNTINYISTSDFFLPFNTYRQNNRDNSFKVQNTWAKMIAWGGCQEKEGPLAVCEQVGGGLCLSHTRDRLETKNAQH